MDIKLPFRVVQGTEAKITSSIPQDGYVYFALDTKRIFYGDSEKGFLPMGGNSGIYYGTFIPPDGVDSDQTIFNFTINDIEGNQLPNIDDLILNSNGCFYRVKNITLDSNDEIIIITEKLTVAGGGGAISNALIKLYDKDSSYTKYFSTDEEEINLTFTLTSTLAHEAGIASLEVRLGSKRLETLYNKEFGEFTINLKPYINDKNNQFSTLEPNNIIIQVIDEYGNSKTFYDYNIYLIEMALKPNIVESILLFDNNTYQYKCTPNASKSLDDVQLHFDFYNLQNIKITSYEQNLTFQNLGNSITVPLQFSDRIGQINLEEGVYDLHVYLTGNYIGASNQIISKSSNIIKHRIIRQLEQDIFAVQFDKINVEQYTTALIDCMIASGKNIETAVINFEIYNIDTKESSLKQFNIQNKKISSLDWYCDKLGTYNLTISYGSQEFKYYGIRVVKYTGNIPTIEDSNLILNLSAMGRSNSQSNKEEWNGSVQDNIDYPVKFNNFYWGNINGWMKDKNTNNSYLHLTSGAEIEIENFKPFENNVLDVEDKTTDGMTIELDFKISGVLDYSKPLITCLSKDENDKIAAGFQLTGAEGTFNTKDIKATGGEIKEGNSESDQVFNTAIQGLTARYVENERIKLTWVIEKQSGDLKYPKIITYINGIISGFTKYEKSDELVQSPRDPAIFKINSTYADIDIYNIRFYQSALNSNQVLGNYIATLDSNDEKVAKFTQNDIIRGGKIDLNTISTSTYNLGIPYIKLTGGTPIKKDWSYDSARGDSEDETRKGLLLPVTKKDFRLMDFEYFNVNNPEDNLKFTTKIAKDSDGKILFDSDGIAVGGCKVYGQGTSSMEYPVKNLRIELRENSSTKKLSLLPGLPKVKRFCLKADYMESSGSHNTGTGNFVDILLKNAGLKTPGQIFYDNLPDYNYDTITAIKGFPVVIFWSPDGNDYEYIGKYNFNLDKSTHEPFGFVPYPEEEKDVISSNINLGWDVSNPEEPQDVIRCFEFLNNASDLANFKNTAEVIKNGEEWLAGEIIISDTVKGPASLDKEDIIYAADNGIALCDEDGKETFFHCFFKKKTFKDGAFVDITDEEGNKVYNWQNSLEARYPDPDPKPGGDKENYIDRKYAIQFFEVCDWINKTKDDDETFKAEFEQYFNHDFVSFYYVLTHFLLMIDSRAKNMMIASWGPETNGGKHIWYPIFYDMDTMLGLNNYGYNKFNYDLLDTKEGLFNSQNSILWDSYRRNFPKKIQDTYNKMRTSGLNYKELLTVYNKNQADKWNESLYNEDAEYKYDRPFSEGFWSSKDGDTSFWVEPEKKDYYYAAQGPRSMHRKHWLSNRFPFMDGFYLSDGIKGDRFTLRLYTPQKSEEQFIKYFIENEEQFNSKKNELYYYYAETTTDENGQEVIVRQYYKLVDFDYETSKSIDLYVKASAVEVEKLNTSIDNIPPNSNFYLIPLKNSYLSVAYGGGNGSIAGPIEAKANSRTLISAPLGGVYNDTETYIYGGSELQSLGDLSFQYLGRFDFPDTTSKLKELILGNPNNNYYNPNFSALTVGKNAPYLELLNIMNCNGLSRRSLNVSECFRLKTILATGTGLTSIGLPEYGVLEELRLPSTINSLKIMNQPELTTDKFTIGTCDYNVEAKTYNYTNVLDSLTKITISNVPKYDSYNLVKNSSNLYSIYLPDINWTISNLDDLTIENDILTGIKILDFIGNPENKFVSDKTNIELKEAIKGIIKIILPTEKTIKVEAINLYNKYANIFPYIKFIYENYSDDSIMTHTITCQNEQGDTLWEKDIVKGAKTNEEFFNTSPIYGALLDPQKASNSIYDYSFEGWQIKGEDELIDLYNFQVNSDIILVPSFKETVKTYSIIYYKEDGITEEERLEFKAIKEDGTPGIVPSPSKIPYKSANDLELTECYILSRYIDIISEQSLNKNISTWSATRDYQVCPEFQSGSVYDNILESKYYTIDSSTGYLRLLSKLESGVELIGKITLPLNLNIKGISSAQDQKSISHIFWQKTSDSIDDFTISDSCFQSFGKLVYFEMPSNALNISIGNSSFNSCFDLFNNTKIKQNELDKFFKNVKNIGGYAFANVNKGLSGKTLIFYNLSEIGSGAFNNTNLAYAYIKNLESLIKQADSFPPTTTISDITDYS